jgi:hypothetical protein
LGLLFKEISFGISLNRQARIMRRSVMMRRQEDGARRTLSYRAPRDVMETL